MRLNKLTLFVGVLTIVARTGGMQSETIQAKQRPRVLNITGV